MRLARPAATVILFAALVEGSLLACSRHSYSDVPAQGDDAAGDDGDDAASPFGDDGSSTDDVYQIYEAGFDGPPCALPEGTYKVTATPVAEAGPTCVASTSTVTFDADAATFGDGGQSCVFTPAGQPPVCAVQFMCTDDDGFLTRNTSGFIEEVGSSFAGSETVLSFVDSDAGFPVSTCEFTLEYSFQ